MKFSPEDPTPIVGAATDVAPLGQVQPKPQHELTADEDPQIVDWDAAAALPEFKALMCKKARFVIPATAFFLVYYFALPISVGYFPQFMSRTVCGVLNIAYLFALSQFFMAWIIAGFYVRKAGGFDRDAEAIIKKITKS
jgi:uncharacterized membrane protein (DUF485 family)